MGTTTIIPELFLVMINAHEFDPLLKLGVWLLKALLDLKTQAIWGSSLLETALQDKYGSLITLVLPLRRDLL